MVGLEGPRFRRSHGLLQVPLLSHLLARVQLYGCMYTYIHRSGLLQVSYPLALFLDLSVAITITRAITISITITETIAITITNAIANNREDRAISLAVDARAAPLPTIDLLLFQLQILYRRTHRYPLGFCYWVVPKWVKPAIALSLLVTVGRNSPSESESSNSTDRASNRNSLPLRFRCWSRGLLTHFWYVIQLSH